MVNTGARLGSEAQDATRAFYRRATAALVAEGVPFLLGGGFAFAHYTGIRRETKDLDLFVRPGDAEWTIATIAAAGYRGEMVAPHWLGKVYAADAFIDVIFSSGNGVARVDEDWFLHAQRGHLLGFDVMVCPVEEMIWSKAFVLERERYDGADVAHLLLKRGARLDWHRLLRRFEPHWQVLLSHLALFQFIYPAHRALIPRWVMRGLSARLVHDMWAQPSPRRICQGTLLSARQYLADVEDWRYEDARTDPDVHMTAEDIALLTRSVKAEAKDDGAKPTAGRDR